MIAGPAELLRGMGSILNSTENQAHTGDHVSTRRSIFRDPWLMLAIAISILIIGWVPAVYLFEPIEFAVLTPAAQVGVEAAAALARLFAALVLLLLPKAEYGRRIRWIASGLVVIGIGSVVFGSFPYAFNYSVDRYEAVYGSLFVSALAGLLFLIGLLPAQPPRLSWTIVLLTIVAVLALKLVTFVRVDLFPPLWEVPPFNADTGAFVNPLQRNTTWYWIVISVPLLITVTGVAGAVIQYLRRNLHGWLMVAMVIWAGSQLHDVLWPSTYDLEVTTTDALRLAFATVIVVAGVLALHRSALEYARLLEMEQRMSQNLATRSALKDDFTSVVAHELGSPVAAIRRYAEMVGIGDLDEEQRRSLQAIHRETEALRKLVADVQAIKIVEMDNFSVHLRSVPVGLILEEAESFAATLEGHHPLICTHEHDSVQVMADPVRLGQVLRNLLHNAAKYSPAGTAIQLRTYNAGHHIRFEVIDHGQGIDWPDHTRIFEKFERGNPANAGSSNVGGTGLGLYLSQCIIHGHMSEIRVESSLGRGSTFAFMLEIAS